MKDILRDLSGFTEYKPGRGIEEVARDAGVDPGDMVKLSSNENPLGPPETAVQAIRDAADSVNVYPTSIHEDTAQIIAEKQGIPRDNLVLGPGADGVFDYIGRAVIEDGDSVLTPSPGFSYYGMSARNQGGEENTYSLRKEDDLRYSADTILEAYTDEKIVYITSPNNPTGSVMGIEEVERVADGVDGLVFVDEAYWEFSKHPSCAELALSRDDVSVARTFSKAYGLAALRVGYGIVPSGFAEAYRKVMTPFCVGSLSLMAAQKAVQSESHLERSVELARWGRRYISREAEPTAYPSSANFVLLDIEPQTAETVTNKLESRGVIVRDTTSFGLPSCIRVSVGTENQTKRAVKAINEVCG